MTKEVFLKKLGKNIARLREEAGLNQTDFAFKLDKDRQSMNRVEKGRTNPSIYFLHEIAKELNVSLADLLAFE
jgi:putative transcriptional regulator